MSQHHFHLTILTYAIKVIETLRPQLQAKKNPGSQTPHSVFEMFVEQQRTVIRGYLII